MAGEPRVPYTLGFQTKSAYDIASQYYKGYTNKYSDPKKFKFRRNL